MEISQYLQSVGDYIDENIHPAILHAVIFLIPVNIYVIGDWLGAGIQWPLFRYQETYLGTSLISIFSDARYVISGTFHGKTSFSVVLWILGAILLVAALIVALWQGVENANTSSSRIRGYLLLSGAILFLLSSIVQYGLLLHGPAGIFIPVGVPVLLILGFLVKQDGGQVYREEASNGPESQNIE